MEGSFKRLRRTLILPDHLTFGKLNRDMALYILFQSGLSLMDAHNLCLAAPSLFSIAQDKKIWDGLFHKFFDEELVETQKAVILSLEKENAQSQDYLVNGRTNLAEREEIIQEMQEVDEIIQRRKLLPQIFTQEWERWNRKKRVSSAAFLSFYYVWKLKRYFYYAEMAGWWRHELILTFQCSYLDHVQIRIFNCWPPSENHNYNQYEANAMMDATIQVHPADDVPEPEALVLRNFLSLHKLDILETKIKEDNGHGFDAEEMQITCDGFVVRQPLELIYALLTNKWKIVPDQISVFPSYVQAGPCANCHLLDPHRKMLPCKGPCRGNWALYCSEECVEKHALRHVMECSDFVEFYQLT